MVIIQSKDAWHRPSLMIIITINRSMQRFTRLERERRIEKNINNKIVVTTPTITNTVKYSSPRCGDKHPNRLNSSWICSRFPILSRFCLFFFFSYFFRAFHLNFRKITTPHGYLARLEANTDCVTVLGSVVLMKIVVKPKKVNKHALYNSKTPNCP